MKTVAYNAREKCAMQPKSDTGKNQQERTVALGVHFGRVAEGLC